MSPHRFRDHCTDLEPHPIPFRRVVIPDVKVTEALRPKWLVDDAVYECVHLVPVSLQGGQQPEILVLFNSVTHVLEPDAGADHAHRRHDSGRVDHLPVAVIAAKICGAILAADDVFPSLRTVPGGGPLATDSPAAPGESPVFPSGPTDDTLVGQLEIQKGRTDLE